MQSNGSRRWYRSRIVLATIVLQLDSLEKKIKICVYMLQSRGHLNRLTKFGDISFRQQWGNEFWPWINTDADERLFTWPASPSTADICCTLSSRCNRSNTIFYANDLMATNSSLNDSNFLTTMLYKNINRFDDIWLMIFSCISRIHCLVAVCQPLIKLLLTYLLTYLNQCWCVNYIYVGDPYVHPLVWKDGYTGYFIYLFIYLFIMP